MGKKRRLFPLLFFFLGLLLIVAVVGLSIKPHLVNSLKEKPSALSLEKDKTENKSLEEKDDKLFFNKPEKDFKNMSIKVYKKRRVLELYEDEKVIGRFKIGLGRAPEGDKEKEGDSKTPEGTYYVCSRTSETKYYYFFGISYPNEKDAKKGLDKGMINENTYNKIVNAIKNKQQPPWNTPLGGAVGIHGGSNKYDWTYGCVGLSNEDMEILKTYVKIGTKVEIYK